MALKDHSLDQPILEAAAREFLENGFEKASLRKIAAGAGVTIGAIHTRYRTKDSLFQATVEPLLRRIGEAFSRLKGEYYRESETSDPEEFARVIREEAGAVLHLLFDDYDRARLLLCCSGGSSLEQFFDSLVQRKIQETLLFFQNSGIRPPDENVLKILIAAQFHMYIQVIRDGYPLEEARRIMDSVMIYHIGGWISLFQSNRNQFNHQEEHHEV